MIASPETNRENLAPFVASILIPPAEESLDLLVTVREFALASGEVWEVPIDSQPSDSNFVDRSLLSGNLRVTTNAPAPFDVVPESNFSLSDATTMENTGSAEAIIVELRATVEEPAVNWVPAAPGDKVFMGFPYQTSPGLETRFVLARITPTAPYQPGVNSSSVPAIRGVVESGSFKSYMGANFSEATGEFATPGADGSVTLR
ncbi:MAG: hypothetical protein ACRDHN_14745, partial [Thermomicrobiales bacterium]